MSLIGALVSCAETSTRLEARRFLLGLSRDELQFIAAFLGTRGPAPPGRPAAPIFREDRDHKLILLREYLSISGLENRSPARRAAAAFN